MADWYDNENVSNHILETDFCLMPAEILQSMGGRAEQL